jgi:secreted trypsin-like serine protease
MDSDVVNVQRAIRHPDFDSSDNANDIALLELAVDVFEQDYKIQYLNVGLTMPPIGTSLQITGYGRLAGDQPTSQAHTGTVPVVEDSLCAFSGYNPDMSFCVSNPKVYSCSGDSGTSVVIKPNSKYVRWVVVGIDSYGAVGYCGSRPPATTNTKVASYIDWIEANTPLAPIVTVYLNETGQDPFRSDGITPASKVLSRFNNGATINTLFTCSLIVALLLIGFLIL